MFDSLNNLSAKEILNYIDSAIEYHDLQDHLYFRNYNGEPFKPNPKQLEYFATGLHARERALIAANRFGKTLCVSLEVCAHLTGNYPDWWNGYRYDRPLNVWAAGVTSTEIIQLKGYYVGNSTSDGWIHPSLILHHDGKKDIYSIKHSSGGVSKLRFKSHEQGRASWQAEKVDIIHIDEEYPYSIHSEAVTRTASTKSGDYGMVLSSLMPLKGVTQLILHFIQMEDDETGEVFNVSPGEIHNSIVYINATHDDSLHLSAEEKKRLYNTYSPEEREARTKGIPSIGSGLIYPVREELYVCSPFAIPEHWPRCFGLDFGWHHPTAAVFLAHDQDNDVVYAYAEYAARQLTPQHHSYELIKQGADWIPGAYDHAGRSSNQSDGSNVVDLYIKCGIKNLVPADKRSVNEGIYTILQRMENGKFKVFSTLSKFLTEIRMYARDENGKIKKGNDDLMDALRYAVVTGIPMARVKQSLMNKWKIPNYTNSQGNFVRF